MIPAQLIRIKALDQTKSAFKSVNAGLGSVASKVFNLQNALIGLAGVAGFGYMIKSSLSATDALAKTASKIGTTTDALSKLHHASTLSGVSTDTMNMALQRFTRRVSEASKGTGEAVGALRELGINANDIQRLPLDQRMIVLANAFGDVTSESDKLRLAFKLFDSEGAGLINMLNNGADGLSAMFDEAEDLGLVMRQMSANGVERASDAMYKLTSIASGLFSQFSASLAPAIEFTANALKNILVDTGKTAGGFKALGDYLAIGFIDSLIKGLESFQDLINEMGKGVSKLSYLYKTLTFGFSDDEKKNKLLTEQRNNVANLIAAYQKLDGGRYGIEMVKMLTDARNSLKGTGIELPKIEDADFLEKMQGIAITLMNTSTALGSDAPFSVNFSKIIKLLKDGKGAIGDLDFSAFVPDETEVTKLTQFSDMIKGLTKDIPDLGESMKDITRGAMDGFTQAFSDAITGAKNFGESIKDLAKSVVDSLIKMLVQYYITKPLFDAISGSFGGGSTSSGTSYQADSVVGSLSYGGTVSAGQPYKVGERGAEMFIPNSNGAIVSSDNLGGGSGVVINQTINLSTGVAQTVKAEVMNMMPQIARTTKQAVLDSRQRGGAYSRGLVGA
ncbi:MAG: phage tail tape measure C-terminal domain-containing protein [Bacteroidota bacterium]